MVKTLIPALLLVCGIYCCAAIFRPGLRPSWRGTDRPMGALACAGFALFFVSIGTFFLFADAEPGTPWFIIPALLGWVLAVAGYFSDGRMRPPEARERSEPTTL